jgi:hypothetical protein
LPVWLLTLLSLLTLLLLLGMLLSLLLGEDKSWLGRGVSFVTQAYSYILCFCHSRALPLYSRRICTGEVKALFFHCAFQKTSLAQVPLATHTWHCARQLAEAGLRAEINGDPAEGNLHK